MPKPQALRDKKCIAWVYDDLPSCPIFPRENLTILRCLWLPKTTTLGLAVPLAEKDCIFGHFLNRITFNMHQSGRLIELEQKHGIQSTNYLVIQKYRTIG